jgi:hypothetical protein
MLSFTRENGAGTSLPQAQGLERPTTRENAAGTQQEYLTVESQDKNVRRSTVLLTGLFILGLLCLWLMIKKSVPQPAMAKGAGIEDAQIETAITRLVGVRSEMFDRMGEIVKKFYEFSDVQQIKVNELTKNPFKNEIFLGSLNETSDTEKSNSGAIRQQQLKGMRLLSIVATGSGKCCIIDDIRLLEGDSIGDFKVSRIGDSTVSLESDGVEMVLKLSE